MKKFNRAVLFLFSVFAFSGVVYGQSDTTMVVTSGGNVGIGTVTPVEKFSVIGGRILVSRTGDFLVDPSAQWGDETMRISDTDAQLAFYSLASGAGSGGIFMKEVDDSGLLNNQWLISRTTGASSLNFTYGTETDFSTDVKIMTVHSNGNVGIGTVNPTEILQLNDFSNGDSSFVKITTKGVNASPAGPKHAGIKLRHFNDGFGWTISSVDDNQNGSIHFKSHFDDLTGITRLFIDRVSGNMGIGMSAPAHPLEMASGAHVTAGGVWTDASSRTLKENIQDLTSEQALEAFMQLSPKQYNYIRDSEESHLGFIAEEVPDIVAMNNRKSLSPMDIVALLTKVVQEQQSKISELESRLNANY